MPDTIDTTQTAGSESDHETVEDATESNEDATNEDATDESAEAGDDDQDEPDTFPRAYVEELRKENATYREKAKTADTLAQRLHTALVAATGKLADPTDMPFDEAHLDDADKLAAAIDELLERKPHLKSRRPAGDVGQGAQGRPAEAVDLAALLRARA